MRRIFAIGVLLASLLATAGPSPADASHLDEVTLTLSDEPPTGFWNCLAVLSPVGSDRFSTEVRCYDGAFKPWLADDPIRHLADDGFHQVGQANIGTRTNGGAFPRLIVFAPSSVGPNGCSLRWMDFRDAWWVPYGGSTCGGVLGAPGSPGDAVHPSTVEVSSTSLTGASREVPAEVWHHVDSIERVMFFDPEVSNGRFASSEVSFGFEENFGKAIAPIGLYAWSIHGSALANGSLRYTFADVAYSRPISAPANGDPRPDMRRVSIVDWATAPSQQIVTLVPTVNATIELGPHQTAETDVFFAWDDVDRDGMWGPAEGFDVAIRTVMEPLRLVALGDSFATGEGTAGAFRSDCARAPAAYSASADQGRFIDGRFTPAAWWGDSSATLTTITGPDDPDIQLRSGGGSRFAYLACDGARTDSVIKESWAAGDIDPFKGQIRADERDLAANGRTQLNNAALSSLTDPNVVTITIGGNDSGFTPLLTACAIVNAQNASGHKVDQTVQTLWNLLNGQNPLDFLPGTEPPVNKDCEIAFQGLATYNDGQPLNPDGLSGLRFLEDIVEPRIEQTFTQINNELVAGPQNESGLLPGEVYVFGYPILFTDFASCPENAGLGQAAIDSISDSQRRLNAIISDQATAAGFRYVDPKPRFDGRGICSDEPLLNGIEILNFDDDRNLLLENSSAHPNEAGWKEYTEAWYDLTRADGVTYGREPTGLPSTASLPPAPLMAGSQTSHANVLSELPPAPGVSMSILTETETQCGVSTYPINTSLQIELTGPASAEAFLAVVDPSGSQVFAAATGVIPAAGVSTVTIDLPAQTGPYEVMLLSGTRDLVVYNSSTPVFAASGQRSCAADDLVQPGLGETTQIEPLSNDALTDGATWELSSLAVIAEPSSGTATVNAGQITYVPDEGFAHIDRLSYLVCDSFGACSRGEVTIDYTPNCTVIGSEPGVLLGTSGDDIICGSPFIETIHTLGGDDAVYPGGGSDLVLMGTGGGEFHWSAETRALQTDATVTQVGTVPSTEAVSVVDPGRPTLVDDKLISASHTASINPTANDTANSALDPTTFEVTTTAESVFVDRIVIEGESVVLSLSSTQPVEGSIVEYKICDIEGRCGSALISVTLGDQEPTDAPPVANDDSASVDAGASVSVPVLSNDTDPDGDLDEGSLRILTEPELGTATVSAASIVFQADSGTDGTQTITYEVCDLTGLCATAVLTIVVNPVHAAPVAQDDSAVVDAGGSIIIEVLDNDTDLDGDLDEGSLRIVSSPTSGAALVVTDAVDGTHIEYTAAADFDGTVTFTYEVCDETGLCDTATVSVVVGTASCTIVGTPGNDVLIGTEGEDVICGLGGNDTIEGLGGNDILVGGPGQDTIDAGPGDDSVFGGRGHDQLNGGDGNDTIRGGRGADTIHGGDGNDILRGGRGADSIHGDSGNDVLMTGAGNDEARGGDGDDEIRGRRGSDDLRGGPGDDAVFGGRGDDELRGGLGDDVLRGFRGADVLRGGSGNDFLYGGRGADQLFGQDGADELRGGRGADVLRGGKLDDLLFGNRGADDLVGGSGVDTARGGRGVDVCDAEIVRNCEFS